MKRSIVETLLGALVVIVAVGFFMYSTDKADIGTADGYTITADFSGIGGLSTGDDVQISGVKVGSVEKVELDQQSFLARVTFSVKNGIELPADTAAMISSESLLGGLYMALEPGAEEDIIAPGGHIEYTQAPQNLEQLLGQFIFSLSDEKEK